ncbi:SRPBCC domain-containing protein [Petrachloros mirabilis]
MSDIKQTYDIATSPAEVWRALTDPKMIEEWSGAGAVFPLEVGATYSLWDGSIGGKIIEIVLKQKLVQTWKPQDWTRTDSVVIFKLTPHGKGTRVGLVHVNVEDTDYDGTSEGWNEYYLGAIQRMFDTKSKSAKHAKEIKAVKKPTKKKGARKKAPSRRKS